MCLKKSVLLFAVSICTICVFSQKDSIAFLALGDSYTAATGELRINSWPEQLVDILNKKNLPVKAPRVLAKAGWTTTDLLNAVDDENLKADYDMVGLLIGVNNQYKKLPIKTFKTELNALIEICISLAQNRSEGVFILSIPDWSVTPFARFENKDKIVSELALYNELIESAAKKHDVLLIDITKASRNMGVNPSLIVSDSLHPSKKMYKAWAKKIGKKILKQSGVVQRP